QSLPLRLAQAIEQGTARQFHPDDEEIGRLPGPEERQDVRMSQTFHDLQGAQLDPGGIALADADELEGDVDIAGWRPARLPDLAVAALAQEANQLVARQWLESRGQHRTGRRHSKRRLRPHRGPPRSLRLIGLRVDLHGVALRPRSTGPFR